MQAKIRFAGGTTVAWSWLYQEQSYVQAQTLLAAAYETATRPVCLCQSPPLALYVRRFPSGRFGLARMPGTKDQHAPGCELFLDDPETATVSSSDPSPRLVTLETLLARLWHETHLNLWNPHSPDRMRWAKIHDALTDHAGDLRFDDQEVARTLFIPRPFEEIHKEAIGRETTAFFTRMVHEGQPPLVLGQIRKIQSPHRAHQDHKIFFNHLHLPVRLAPEAFGSFMSRYGETLRLLASATKHLPEITEIQFHNEPGKDRLLCLAQVGVVLWKERFLLKVRELALLRTTACYLPAHNHWESLLANHLVKRERRFMKPLWPDSEGNLPAFLLLDTHPAPCNLAVIDHSASTRQQLSDYRMVVRLLSAQKTVWAWSTGDSEAIPPLPPLA